MPFRAGAVRKRRDAKDQLGHPRSIAAASIGSLKPGPVVIDLGKACRPAGQVLEFRIVLVIFFVRGPESIDVATHSLRLVDKMSVHLPGGVTGLRAVPLAGTRYVPLRTTIRRGSLSSDARS